MAAWQTQNTSEEARVTDAIKTELAKGTGVLKTARLCGCGVSVVQKIKR
jgi:hypothetical protein